MSVNDTEATYTYEPGPAVLLAKKLDSPSALVDYLRAHTPELFDGTPQECIAVVTVDCSLRPISAEAMFKGALTAAFLDPACVARKVILDNASGVFMAHNHPSGDPEPSSADRRSTEQLARALRLFKLVLHDHIVVAGDSWRSCME